MFILFGTFHQSCKQSIIKSNSYFVILKLTALVCVVPHVAQGQDDTGAALLGDLVPASHHFAAAGGKVNIYYQELALWGKPKGQVYLAQCGNVQGCSGYLGSSSITIN